MNSAENNQLMSWYQGLHQLIQATPDLAPLREHFQSSPEDLQNLDAMRGLHRQAMLTTYRSPQLVDLLIAAIDYYQKQILKIPALPASPSEQQAASDQFIEKGHAALSPWTDETKLDEMRQYLGEQQVRENSIDSNSTPCSIEMARTKTNVGVIASSSLPHCPHIWEFALAQDALMMARDWLGTLPTILDVSAWWSFKEAAQAEHAQYFHLDKDDHRFCKQFMYLTDVDEQAGPHVFVETSHRSEVIFAKFADWPGDKQQFIDWFAGKLRKTDEEVQQYLNLPEVRLTGPRGSRMLVSTQGIHKGLMPQGKDRLIVQVLYGVSPLQTVSSIPVPVTELPNPPQLDPPLDFMTRLYLSSGVPQ